MDTKLLIAKNWWGKRGGDFKLYLKYKRNVCNSWKVADGAPCELGSRTRLLRLSTRLVYNTNSRRLLAQCLQFLQAASLIGLQRFYGPLLFLLGLLKLCCITILAMTLNTLLFSEACKVETSFKTIAFLVCSFYLYTIIIVFFRRWGGWRLHLHIIADWWLPLPLGILFSSASPALWLNLLTAVGREKRKEENLIFIKKNNNKRPFLKALPLFTVYPL